MILIKNGLLFLLLITSYHIFSQNSYNTIYNMDSISIASEYDVKYWNWVKEDLHGIEGYTPDRLFIDKYPAEKFSAFSEGNWFPIDGYKHILKGTITDAQLHFGDITHDYELDFNWIVSPSKQFKYLIDFNLFRIPEVAKLDSRSKHYRVYDKILGLYDTLNEWHRNKFNNNEYCIEAEVTTHENFSFQNPIFIPENPYIWRYKSTAELLNLNKTIADKEVCFYGPWVYEYWHDNRPEIHPAELVWWTQYINNDSSKSNLLILRDNTEYFNDEDDFLLPEQLESLSPEWKPWNDSTVNANYNIGFHIPNSSNQQNMLYYELTNMLESEDNTQPLIRNVRVFDNFKKDTLNSVFLLYKNKPIVKVFVKDLNLRKRLKISFGGLRLLQDSSIIGFIKIKADVGVTKDVKFEIVNETNLGVEQEVIIDGYLGFEMKSRFIDLDTNYTKSKNIYSVINPSSNLLKLSATSDDIDSVNSPKEIFRKFCISLGKGDRFPEYYNIVTKGQSSLINYEINTVENIKKRVFFNLILNEIDQNKRDDNATVDLFKDLNSKYKEVAKELLN